MNLHEYQAKTLLKEHGLNVLDGMVAHTPEEAEAAVNTLGAPCAVKAQIHAGGRGKGTFSDSDGGGGVRLAQTAKEARSHAEAMLNHTLKTHQTGPEGRKVRRLYVESGCDIQKELYLSLVVDRSSGRATFVASTEGGVDIEDVAKNSPEKIVRLPVDPLEGGQPYIGRRVAFGLGLSRKTATRAARFIERLYKMYTALDAQLVEINPLVVTGAGDVVALDAKITLDENALFRHENLKCLFDADEADPREVRAAQHNLSYIPLSGNIGCLVNGAGLAMATMDIIKLHGGEPANFLDVGGGATRERVREAFKIILSDQQVEGILVNIFGGIMRCDIIAEGVTAAGREIGLNVPLVVRLEGTNVERGKKILSASGLPVLAADSLQEAAEKIVAAVREES